MKTEHFLSSYKEMKKRMQSKAAVAAGLLGILSLVAMVSCGDNTTLTPYKPDNTGPLKYEIKGLKDTSLERVGEVRYLISAERTSGQPENVILSAENLPKGMEVFFEPTSAAQPSFSTTMRIKATRTPEGLHAISIKGASATSGIKLKNITVNVLPYTNPAIGLVGYFTEAGQCALQGSINDNVNIVADETVKNKIYIRGLFSGVMTNEVYAVIDPSAKTLQIPVQVQNAVTFEGDGTFDDDKLIVNYKVTGATFNESCTSTLTRY